MTRLRWRSRIVVLVTGLSTFGFGSWAPAADGQAPPPPAPGGPAAVLRAFEDTIAGYLANALRNDPGMDEAALRKKAADLCVKFLAIRDPGARMTDADAAFADRLADAAWGSREKAVAMPPVPPAPAPAPPTPAPPAPLPGPTRDLLKALLQKADADIVQTAFNNSNGASTPSPEERAASLKDFVTRKPTGQAGSGTFLDAFNAATRRSVGDYSQLSPDDRKAVDAMIEEVVGVPPSDGGGPTPPAPAPPPAPEPQPGPEPEEPYEVIEYVIDGTTYEVPAGYVIRRGGLCWPFRGLGTRRGVLVDRDVYGYEVAPLRTLRGRYIIVEP